MATIPPFVKKFDFRGIYNQEITDQDAYFLGLAITKVIPLKKVLLGWDTRVSSKNLAYNFIKALQKTDVKIYYLNKCPIDYITSAANEFDFDLSVMFTGSHNPWTWTGLLMHQKGGASLENTIIEKLINTYNQVKIDHIDRNDPDLSLCHNFYKETETAYAEKLKRLVPLKKIKKINIVVDCGDGSGSRSLSILEKLLPQIKITRINDNQTYDQYSSHIADPSSLANMQDLIHAVKNGKFNAGFAFDSDADRMLAVDEKGNYLTGSLLGSAQASCFLQQNLPDKHFGYAVDCGPSLPNTIIELNNKHKNLSFEAIPVGRSIIRNMIRENLDFGVENVGHFYSKDFFQTDSGVFSLAVILYWISVNGPLSTLLEKHPDGKRNQVFSPASQEIDINTIIEKMKNQLKKTEIRKIEVDGTRFEFLKDKEIISWIAERKSGYEPIIKYYYGALDNFQFESINKFFFELNPTVKSL